MLVERLMGMINGLQERIKDLHTAYGVDYMSKARTLLVGLPHFASVKSQRGNEVWMDLMELFCYQWSGSRNPETAFAFDGEDYGASAYQIETLVIPGTIFVSWIKVNRVPGQPVGMSTDS